jgi:hypothetical protein
VVREIIFQFDREISGGEPVAVKVASMDGGRDKGPIGPDLKTINVAHECRPWMACR